VDARLVHEPFAVEAPFVEEVAVVAGEDDDGVAGEAVFPEGVTDAADSFVNAHDEAVVLANKLGVDFAEFLDAAAVEGEAVGAHPVRKLGDGFLGEGVGVGDIGIGEGIAEAAVVLVPGAVGCLEADGEAERFIRRGGCEEFPGMVGEDLGDVAVLALGGVVLALPEEAAPEVEAVFVGFQGGFDGGGDAPFADEADVVAGALEDEGVEVLALFGGKVGAEVAHAGGAVVDAAEDGGAVGGAGGGDDVGAVEGDALAGEAVHFRGGDDGVAGCAQGVVALVVGEEEDDVGALLSGCGQGEADDDEEGGGCM